VSLDLAIVVGHSQDAPGARDLNGVSERDWCDDLAGWVALEAGLAAMSSRVFHRPDDGHYRSKMARLTGEINAAKPRFVLALHFNAGGGGAGVVAVNYPGSKRGQQAAVALSRAVATVQCSVRSRVHDFRGQDGIPRSWQPTITDAEGRQWPGGPELYILSLTRAPAVILETHSGRDALDLANATRHRDDGSTARAVVDVVADLLHEWA